MPQDLLTGDEKGAEHDPEIERGQNLLADDQSTAPERPKRELSPEHLAKLQEGRDRATQRRAQSRGRPASRPETAPMPRERSATAQTDQALEDDIDYAALAGTLTRQSRLNGDNTFDIPQQGRVPGWDYQWWPTHVMGQEVDASETVECQRGGWIVVPAKHFPQLVPPGWQRPTIDRRGQRLHMRPMRLTVEAHTEQYNLSKQVLRAKLEQAQAGDAGRDFAPRDPRATSIQTELRPLLD